MKVRFERAKNEVAHTVLSKVAVLHGFVPCQPCLFRAKSTTLFSRQKSASVDASKEGQPIAMTSVSRSIELQEVAGYVGCVKLVNSDTYGRE